MKWIRIEDQLPEHNQQVLFVFRDGEGSSSWYKYPTTLQLGDFHRDSPTQGTFRLDCRPVANEKITHWIPIPKSPLETLNAYPK